MAMIKVTTYVTFPAFSILLLANCALICSNDRLRRKHNVECDTEITVGRVKKLIAETSQPKVDHSNVYPYRYKASDKGKGH